VLEQNKDDANENDGGKANYDLFAIPIKQGSVSIADIKSMRIAYFAQAK
jgi:hypothetical protein